MQDPIWHRHVTNNYTQAVLIFYLCLCELLNQCITLLLCLRWFSWFYLSLPRFFSALGPNLPSSWTFEVSSKDFLYVRCCTSFRLGWYSFQRAIHTWSKYRRNSATIYLQKTLLHLLVFWDESLHIHFISLFIFK